MHAAERDDGAYKLPQVKRPLRSRSAVAKCSLESPWAAWATGVASGAQTCAPHLLKRFSSSSQTMSAEEVVAGVANPRSTVLNHTMPPFYACYLLKTVNPKRSATYIGSTPDPPRRIKQQCVPPSSLRQAID